MKKIRLALTEAGLTEDRIARDELGGAERMFMLWERYLKQAGYIVSRWPEPPIGEYDLCIHSNFFDHHVVAKKHIVWGGGWEIWNQVAAANKIIILTDYMRERFDWKPDYCEIVPAPFDHELLSYRTNDFVPHRIVSNSNPSRFFEHMITVANILDAKDVDYEWHFCGGSKLYCPSFLEKYENFEGAHPKLVYWGVLPRHEMVDMLNSGHVLAYPSFDNDLWETQGVAFLEAAALGLPIVLTNKRPFTDVMPEASFASTAEEMAEIIIDIFKFEGRFEYPEISRYDSDVVFKRLVGIVWEMIGGPESTTVS